MALYRDVPAVSGAIIWARQIYNQLVVYMKRVEDVLGEGWDLYAEGQKLKSESISFKRKLDTRALFDKWLSNVIANKVSVSGNVFEISKSRENGMSLCWYCTQTSDKQLAISFDPQLIALFKEVRNLIWLGYQIPHSIVTIARDAKHVYPFAVTLQETMKVYSEAVKMVQSYPTIVPLIAKWQKEIHGLISKGIQLRWEYFVNTVWICQFLIV